MEEILERPGGTENGARVDRGQVRRSFGFAGGALEVALGDSKADRRERARDRHRDPAAGNYSGEYRSGARAAGRSAGAVAASRGTPADRARQGGEGETDRRSGV